MKDLKFVISTAARDLEAAKILLKNSEQSQHNITRKETFDNQSRKDKRRNR